MTYYRYSKDEYPDDVMFERCKERGLSIEQDFYRHKAHLFKCIIKGKVCDGVDEWAERLRDIGGFKFSVVKQIFWIIKIFIKE